MGQALLWPCFSLSIFFFPVSRRTQRGEEGQKLCSALIFLPDGQEWVHEKAIGCGAHQKVSGT